ncbi:MAG: hypothetical protein KKF67_00700, partial [Nanoarchaeota archaeon]|nr:hypothetical protein [Nanoarchaeota archaeon]
PFGLKLICVLDRETGDVGFNQIRPEEIGTKYTLIKGESNLYEQTQPLCTEDITKGPYDPRQTHHPCKID